MKKYFLLITTIALFTSSLLKADWKLKTQKNSKTDEIVNIAYTNSKEGYTFSIFKLKNSEPIWASFSLPETTSDLISGENPLLYRIDENKYNNTSLVISIGEVIDKVFYEWQPKWVNFALMFRIQPKIEDNRKDSPLGTVMNGNNVVVRYYLASGGYKDISFSLKGSYSAIKKALKMH